MRLRKAVKILLPKGAFDKIEPLGHKGEAVLMSARYGFPAKKLRCKIIGVTGTDGKTSTCTLIQKMLQDAGYRVGLLTTISLDDGDGPVPNPTRLTTIGAADLQRKLNQLTDKQLDFLVLEVTSHSLAQYRAWGVPFHLAVMTNMSHEHLDYHKTFERYREAKTRLFGLANQNSKGLRLGISNADDETSPHFQQKIINNLTYGIEKGDLNASNIVLAADGSNYLAKIADEVYEVKINLPGRFNVYNSMAALLVGRALGLSKKQIESGLAALEGVEGRMTVVDEGQNFRVIVDYAHTPESFEKVFKELEKFKKGRVIAVFGSAGRRDEAKRYSQGEVAGKYADIVIATEEDDRDEDGQMILDQIEEGAVRSGKIPGKSVLKIHKREDAVAKALELAHKDDIVILLGKGHEKSILSNGPKARELFSRQQDDSDPERVIKRDYDEVGVAREALRGRGSSVKG